mmetsp:Transcript_48756/g.77691  ORF Transcript_48756/g.77691 Transcript_48756/m.77691 type:complete len:206 (-) Transcript_48756:1734-2351(-)
MFFISGSAPKVNSTSTIQRSSLRAANISAEFPSKSGAFTSACSSSRSVMVSRRFDKAPRCTGSRPRASAAVKRSGPPAMGTSLGALPGALLIGQVVVPSWADPASGSVAVASTSCTTWTISGGAGTVLALPPFLFFFSSSRTARSSSACSAAFSAASRSAFRASSCFRFSRACRSCMAWRYLRRSKMAFAMRSLFSCVAFPLAVT